MEKAFWKGRRVFVTGHTGFKGSWLVMMLHQLGAKIYGYSLDIPTTPSLFDLCEVSALLEEDFRGDICDLEKLKSSMLKSAPEVVFHLAAQPLVRLSYNDPFTTYNTNVMGTLNVLMSAFYTPEVKSILSVTTDKCYENKEWEKGYTEEDELGGHDPYSSSKACAEIVSKSIRSSFLAKSNKVMATARAGNVIGGGDWAQDRLIPDFMRSFLKNETLEIRSPGSTRPWQHVMEPLRGYIDLAEACYNNPKYAQAWNLGPNDEDCKSVEYIVNHLAEIMPNHRPGINILSQNQGPHEANFLKLNCSKIKKELGWVPYLNLNQSLALTAEWYLAYFEKKQLKEFTAQQIKTYLNQEKKIAK
jgi:CDP-glucose 4,6-dehydratase